MPAENINITSLVADVSVRYATQLTPIWLLVHIGNQKLYVIERDQVQSSYTVSTSKFGNGCKQDSLQTPTGAHAIAQKIGKGKPVGEIFSGRQSTGKIAEICTTDETTEQDLILTRIMWLKGLEPNKNSGEGCDSYQRYIYIHGTHEEGLLGTPASHGCVRMSNNDVIELYNQVDEGVFVYID